MKKLIIALLLLVAGVAHTQECYEPKNNGAIGLHYIIKNGGNGFGVSLGNLGRESNLSFLLNAEHIRYRIDKEEADSSQNILGVKFLYRFAKTEEAYFQAFVNPAIVGVDMDVASGLRAMFITGRRVAIAVEPAYWLKTKDWQANLMTIVIF